MERFRRLGSTRDKLRPASFLVPKASEFRNPERPLLESAPAEVAGLESFDVAASSLVGLTSFWESTAWASVDQKRGLSLLFKKLSAEASRLVLEKALTLLDLLSGAFFAGLLSSLSVICCLPTDEVVDAEELVAALLLLLDDLKAETAIFLSAL